MNTFKRTSGKNIKELLGKSLIAYTIEAALKADNVSRVIVSTDCDKIANVAKSFGAEVPFMRPDFLATDTAKGLDAIKYTLDRLQDEFKIDINDFVILQPTSPLRNEKHISEAIALFKNKKAESVVSFCKEDHPIFWHKYITKEGRFKNIFKGDYIKNRQDIKYTYYPNGAIFVFSKNILITGDYYPFNSFAYIMDKKKSVDIDTLDDFMYAEYLISNNEL